MDRERRYLKDTELRMDFSDSKPKLIGYASVFNSLSENLGGFRERILPGAFKKSLKQNDIRALINHDNNLVLGRNKSGTLQLKEDSKGLRFELTPPNTSYARDLAESVQRGDISGCSFAFTTDKDDYVKKDNETIRDVSQATLLDISIVTYPAYADTEVSLRSFEQYKQADDLKRRLKLMEVWLNER